MKILIDMNLSPDWVSVFEADRHEAVHWSRIGEPGAPEGKWGTLLKC
jgi:predicted nuclease of predicted toxin-antitoxin system